MKKFFKVLYTSKKTKARLGEIKTNHGVIRTPSFVVVGTKGTIKTVLPKLLEEIKIQAAFVNTYHLLTHPAVEIIEKAGGIHKWANLDIPLMSDSGGFQIFSLAFKKLKNLKFKINEKEEKIPSMVKIYKDKVEFRSVFDGSLIEFTPEKSIEYQQKIGADIIMAFDECIYYGASYQYTKKATERTHQWLLRCIKKFKMQNLKKKKRQYLYGIIQGGVFEDLRKKSAEFVVNQDIDGVAIGGVSVGESKREMREQVSWVSEFLPKDKPVHLLGVGRVDDILDLVGYGIDTFDCVEPTRLARMGTIYQIQNLKFKAQNAKIEKIDILKGKYRFDLSKVDENCNCYVCQNFTKSYLHHLFKTKELLAYTLATYHNLWVMERFFEWIRKRIESDLI